MITLNKKTGINLKKGASIKLEKEGTRLRQICIGLNWGAIQKKGFLWNLTGTQTVSVDLDGAVSLFAGNQLTETIYYQKLVSYNGAIRHSGDDLTGDLDGDDGLDNEVITIELPQVEPHIDAIYIYLNSYKGQDFGEIPYSKVRIYEGTPDYVNEVLATFNLSVENKFKGYVSMMMGKLTRAAGNKWQFTALGEPLRPRKIPQIETYLRQRAHQLT
ncbi:MAG: TerD family protein [Bacteroidota bacterium]